MRNRQLVAMVGWLAAALPCGPGMSEAATYQLRIASLSERAFMFFVEDRTLPHIEAFLGDSRRSKRILFRDRQPQALQFSAQGEQVVRYPDNVTPPKRNDPWGVTTWHGKAGQLMVFRVRGRQSDHQKVRKVAVQAEGGILTRLPVRRVAASHSRPMQVPVTSASYLAHAMEGDTFLAWAKRRAAEHEGLRVIVGRHPDVQRSDTVYLLVHMGQENNSYKVILGWQDFDHESAHGSKQGGRER